VSLGRAAPGLQLTGWQRHLAEHDWTNEDARAYHRPHMGLTLAVAAPRTLHLANDVAVLVIAARRDRTIPLAPQEVLSATVTRRRALQQLRDTRCPVSIYLFQGCKTRVAPTSFVATHIRRGNRGEEGRPSPGHPNQAHPNQAHPNRVHPDRVHPNRHRRATHRRASHPAVPGGPRPEHPAAPERRSLPRLDRWPKSQARRQLRPRRLFSSGSSRSPLVYDRLPGKPVCPIQNPH
jgi:hypothetical protein